MKDTIGLAAMKIRTARRNSARANQNRCGTRGMRISRPASNGPPRSNGSKGRYRLDICLRRTLEGSQGAVVRGEIRICIRGRVVEVPAHGRAQGLEWVGRGPAERRARLARAGRDVLQDIPRQIEVFGQRGVGDLDE